VPYRDREPQRFFFQNYMTYLMEDHVEHDGASGDYVLLFVEQMDARPFNRGAMKNIGFLAVKKLFPDAYGDIVLVFNDVDVLPYRKNMLRYEPPVGGGTIMHHYGFEFALGGIFSVRASDFERLNGFANYWTWGFEDNLLQNRALRQHMVIDRSNFFPLNDMRILHINDGNKKSLNRQYMYELIKDTGKNGISTIRHLEYDVDVQANAVRVHCFDTEYTPWNGTFEEYDMRNGRDIRAPLSRQMMLDSAMMGNHLETLYFIDENGQQKTSHDLLRDEHERKEKEKEEAAKARVARNPRHVGFMLRSGDRRASTSVPPSDHRASTSASAMMMNIRSVEVKKHSDMNLAVMNEHRTRHNNRYGVFGIGSRRLL
jgi:hypothetical protein